MIKILASKNKEKGDLFEDFAKRLLDAFGFHNFRVDVRKTGRELDIQANHKVTDEPILCECKAHKEKLGGDEVSKFYGVYTHEYDKDQSLKGLFFSLSGFNDQIIDYYNENTEEVKKRFKIFGDTDIEELLKKSGIVKSIETIEYIVKNKIKFDVSRIYLTVSKEGYHWIITFKSNSNEKYFSIYTAKGEEVPKLICDDIARLDKSLRELELINLQARTKVIRSLSVMKSKKIEDISREIEESFTDVEIALKNLSGESIVLKNNINEYTLSEEFDIFLRLIKEFSLEDIGHFFFKSNYVQKNINERLIRYLEARTYLGFDEENRDALYKLLSISPSALFEAILGSTDRYKNANEQIKKLKFGDEKIKKSKEVSIYYFINNLQQKLILDLEKDKLTDFLCEKGIIGYNLVSKLILATFDGPYLSLKSDFVFHLASAEGKIKAGELVAADINAHLENLRLLTVIGKTKEALDGYQTIIEISSEPQILKIAWANRGLIFLQQENYPDAIDCCDRALKHDPNLKQALYNKGLALGHSRRFPEAIETFENLFSLDADYLDAKRHLATWKEQE